MSFVLLCKTGFSAIQMELWLTTYIMISLERGMLILLKMVHIYMASKAPSARLVICIQPLNWIVQLRPTCNFSTRSEQNLY
jgi:hypothetical protein